MNDNNIIQFAINECGGNMHEAARIANLPFTTFRSRAKKLNLYAPNPHGKRNVRARPDTIPLNEILSGEHPEYRRSSLKPRLLRANILENKCEICGICKWNNKKIVMILDHINGVNNDHRIENLRMICPNCNSQTDTFAGRNIKNK